MQYGLENYKKKYYLENKDGLWKPYANKFLNPNDMASCLCYALGIESYDDICQLLDIPEVVERKGHKLWLPENVNFKDQIQIIQSKQTRYPKKILSVGSGRGELEASFIYLGIPVVGCDPAPCIPEIYKQTMLEWIDCDDYVFHNMEFHEVAEMYSEQLMFDTIIFCESLEHIPEGTFEYGWNLIKNHLYTLHGRLIVCNTISNHPIKISCTWNHVRRVDDDLYDRFESEAVRTIFRQGSHLVLQY